MEENPSKFQVAVSGSNSFVAQNLRFLLNQNHMNFFGLARRNFKNYNNETKIITKNFSEKNLPNKIHNCKVFIHLIGIGKQDPSNNFEQTNVELTKKIIQLCKKAKINKIIFLSGLGVSKNSTSSYFISKYKAEQEIIKSGLDYTIFRPSYIIGKNDLLTNNLKKQIKTGTIVIPGTGKYLLQPIFVKDVAKIIVKSFTHKRFSNKIIDLVGPELTTFEKYVKLFNNKKAKIKKISLEDAFYESIHNPKSNFSTDDLLILIGNFVGDFKKLEKITEMNFVSFKKILKSSCLS